MCFVGIESNYLQFMNIDSKLVALFYRHRARVFILYRVIVVMEVNTNLQP